LRAFQAHFADFRFCADPRKPRVRECPKICEGRVDPQGTQESLGDTLRVGGQQIEVLRYAGLRT
jgi:hypothetical protein